MANSFKIFVSSFPDRIAYRRNGIVDVYQMGSIVFKEAKVIENATLSSELYNGVINDDCISGLFNCDERVVAPPPSYQEEQVHKVQVVLRSTRSPRSKRRQRRSRCFWNWWK